jgi:hypothetical protein
MPQIFALIFSQLNSFMPIKLQNACKCALDTPKYSNCCRPGVNFINVKCTNFLYERRFGSFYYVHVTRKKLPKQRSYKKFACLRLMKLTAVFAIECLLSVSRIWINFFKILLSWFGIWLEPISNLSCPKNYCLLQKWPKVTRSTCRFVVV